MGKGSQRRIGRMKTSGGGSVAYTVPPKVHETPHEVDMSGLTQVPCEGCLANEAEGDLTVEQLMDARDWGSGFCAKYWFKTVDCAVCLGREPYVKLTLAELMAEGVPKESVTKEKVNQILAACELRSAHRNVLMMSRIGLSVDKVEVGNRMVKRVKDDYENVKAAKRPPKLIKCVNDVLHKLDTDARCPNKARVVFECADGEASYTLTCLILTGPKDRDLPPWGREVVVPFAETAAGASGDPMADALSAARDRVFGGSEWINSLREALNERDANQTGGGGGGAAATNSARVQIGTPLPSVGVPVGTPMEIAVSSTEARAS